MSCSVGTISYHIHGFLNRQSSLMAFVFNTPEMPVIIPKYPGISLYRVLFSFNSAVINLLAPELFFLILAYLYIKCE